MSEAFVYLWYDAPNDMYYLGKHKGTPDDSYTHSSTIWESFTKDNIPEGVTREILAYGTDEEMCILEHKLLVKAKNSGDWNRYYNESLGDPRYVDMSGENNPLYGRGAERTGENNPHWKGGISSDIKAYMKEYNKEYEQTPQRKAYKKEYYKKRRLTPEYKANRREYENKRSQTPEYKAYRKEYEQTPQRKAYKKEYMREYYARKKAETQGEGTLEAFLK